MEPYEFVKTLDKFIKSRIPTSYQWLRAKCEKLSPLLFSIMDGEIQAGEEKSVKLNMTYAASLCDWHVNDEATAILDGRSLLIIGRVAKEVKPMSEFVKDLMPEPPGWLRAKCESLSPLTFSVMDGRIKAGDGKDIALVLTNSTSQYDWRVGYEAAALLGGDGLLIIERIG